MQISSATEWLETFDASASDNRKIRILVDGVWLVELRVASESEIPELHLFFFSFILNFQFSLFYSWYKSKPVSDALAFMYILSTSITCSMLLMQPISWSCFEFPMETVLPVDMHIADKMFGHRRCCMFQQRTPFDGIRHNRRPAQWNIHCWICRKVFQVAVRMDLAWRSTPRVARFFWRTVDSCLCTRTVRWIDTVHIWSGFLVFRVVRPGLLMLCHLHHWQLAVALLSAMEDLTGRLHCECLGKEKEMKIEKRWIFCWEGFYLLLP